MELRRVVRITIIILLVFVTVLAGAGYYFSGLVISPRVRGYDETFSIEIEKGKIIRADFDALPKEEVFIQSPFGYRLHALYFPLAGSRKTVIIAHGVVFSLMGSIKYLDIFRKRGFNVLVYDHRHHGKSGGGNVTFGWYEKHDMKAVVDWVLKRSGGIVGIHGESMGAAVMLQYAAMDDRCTFYISDCSFSDLNSLLAFRLKQDYGLPAFPLLPAASIVSKLRGAMFFGDVSPVSVLPLIKAPVFFIHGLRDTYVPTNMALEMHTRKSGPKRLYTPGNAGHAESFWLNRKEYDRKIGEFLKETGAL